MRFLRIILLCLCALSCLFSGCGQTENKPGTDNEVSESTADFKGVWLTCYELKNMLSGGSEEAFSEKVENMMKRCVENEINAVFIQVRPFCDSVYTSAYFPVSDYALSSDGKQPEFDVLEKFIEISKNYNIDVHAWINPFRISYESDLNSLPKSSIALSGKYDIAVLKEGIYLDPSSLNNQKLIIDGIREILDKYKVDGIHIDDYFYPVTDEKFDADIYDKYKENGGKLRFNDWRRENINSLVSSVYSLVHSYSDELIFSISPSGDIKKNYSVHYADVELWLEKKGFADMIIPQLYYGFENQTMPFEKVANKWLKLKRAEDVQFICGLALYKQGEIDDMAGSGVNEWIENSNVIERQKSFVAESEFDGYALFSISDIK